jgi:NDP-sugar pyrophosphorylase family protein
MADQFEAYVAQRTGTPRIELIMENSPLGTAGAVALLPDDISGPFLVMNGDILTEVNLQALATMHARNANDATIAVARYEFEIPYGVVRHAEDGAFLGIDEKPCTSHFVSAGLYLLSPQFRALVPPSQPMDMPELLNLGRSVGMRIGLFPIHEYWRDIGRPPDLAAAEEDHGVVALAPTGRTGSS